MLIDADPSVRKGIGRLLSEVGYYVSEYSSLNDFMDDAKQGLSGCIVLDSGLQGLPEMDLPVELKKLGIPLPIIFISADDDPKTRQKAYEMKAAGFFHKPIDGLALVDAIDWALLTEKQK